MFFMTFGWVCRGPPSAAVAKIPWLPKNLKNLAGQVMFSLGISTWKRCPVHPEVRNTSCLGFAGWVMACHWRAQKAQCLPDLSNFAGVSGKFASKTQGCLCFMDANMISSDRVGGLLLAAKMIDLNRKVVCWGGRMVACRSGDNYLVLILDRKVAHVKLYVYLGSRGKGMMSSSLIHS